MGDPQITMDIIHTKLLGFFPLPLLKNDGVRQWGWDYISHILYMDNNPNVPNHQPVKYPFPYGFPMVFL